MQMRPSGGAFSLVILTFQPQIGLDHAIVIA